MNYVKAFAAGITVPSIILPVVLYIASTTGHSQILNVLFLHLIPLIWGVWNILHVTFFHELLKKDMNIEWLVSGAVLGLLVATIGVFWIHVPSLTGIPESLTYLPLVAAPIVYAILWRFVVKPLNELLGVEYS